MAQPFIILIIEIKLKVEYTIVFNKILSLSEPHKGMLILKQIT